MIEGISAVTLGTHEMPRAVRFYRTLGFEVLHGLLYPQQQTFHIRTLRERPLCAISRNGGAFDHLPAWRDRLANLQPLNVTTSVHSVNRAPDMKRKLRNGLIVIAVAVIANYAPLLNGHAEQDNCTFGPVSNADYRVYLARAKALLPLPIPSLLLVDRAFALKLDDLFDNLSRGETNVYSRLAIMHATLRAVGAEYRNTNGNDIDRGASDAYVKAASSGPVISFNYALDVNRLWMFMPWPRDAWIIGSLAGPRYKEPPGPLYPKGMGGIRFIVWGPNILDRPVGDAIRSVGSCPPIPASHLAESFSLRPE